MSGWDQRADIADLGLDLARRRNSEWLDWRRNGIGASDVPAIANLSPWGSPFTVWADKRGLRIAPEETAGMRLGRDLEPIIARWFTDATDLYVIGEQTQCTSPDEPWARCTVDGFVVEGASVDRIAGLDGLVVADGFDALGVFESKYTTESADDVPLHYAAQCQWQMFVTGLPHAWLAVLSLRFGRPVFRVHEVERDEEAIGQLVDICGRFWRDHVKAGTPPPIDGTEATSKALADVYADARKGEAVDIAEHEHLVRRLLGMRRNRDQIEREIRAIENELRAALGDATEGVNGDELLVSWRPQTAHRIDTKRLRAEQPELATAYTNESTSRVFRVHAHEEEQ